MKPKWEYQITVRLFFHRHALDFNCFSVERRHWGKALLEWGTSRKNNCLFKMESCLWLGSVTHTNNWAPIRFTNKPNGLTGWDYNGSALWGNTKSVAKKRFWVGSSKKTANVPQGTRRRRTTLENGKWDGTLTECISIDRHKLELMWLCVCVGVHAYVWV